MVTVQPTALSSRDSESSVAAGSLESSLEEMPEIEIVRDVSATPASSVESSPCKEPLPKILLGQKSMVMSNCLAAAGLLAFVWLSTFEIGRAHV